MYEYLEGRLERRGPARVVVDVGGVGYDLAVPIGAAFDASPKRDRGDRVRVWTHLVVREDAQDLYGFPDADTRDWFRGLLAVRGVGPAVALGVLSGLPTERLLQAILDDDPAPLVAVKGIGRKTAEQILLDLRDRAPKLAAQAAPEAPEERSRTQAMLDAVQALVSIGYKEKEARKSVESAAASVDPDDLEALVRASLQG
ncbi:MAG: Holliday junction branch migration protein RuvA [Planctomycetota bacterium]